MFKINFMKKNAILFLIALLCLDTIYGNTIFVSNNGNDQNSGSAKQPLKTIQKGIDLLNAGDTLIILPGYYLEKLLVENKNASESKPTVIKAIGEVIIDGPSNLDLKGTNLKIGKSELPLSHVDHPYYPYYRGAVLRLVNCKHIIVDGIKIVNSEWMGITSLECDNITIRHCHISDLQASGMYMLNSRFVTIAFNEITRACGFPSRLGGDRSQDYSGHGSQEMLSIVNCTNFEVMYNRIHTPNVWDVYESRSTGVGGEGIDCKENSHIGKVHHNLVYNINRPALYVDAWDAKATGSIEIFNNVAHDAQCGFSLGCENGGMITNIKLYNNLFYNNWLDGILLANWGLGGNKDNVKIFNNTVYYNVSGISLGGEKHTNIVLANNISYLNDKFGKQNLHPEQAKYVEMNNIFGIDPLFIDRKCGNFNLNESSPAVDKGTGEIDLPTFDLNDAARINGSGPDIGAFELGSKPVSPRVIYVSTGGNDANPGTFFAPYRNIQKAIESLHTGDQLCILEGWYREKLLLQNLKGTKDKKIIIKALGKVVIDAPENLTIETDTLKIGNQKMKISSEKHPNHSFYKGSAVRIENCTYLSFSGFTIQNSENTGISTLNASDCEVSACIIKNSKSFAFYNLQSNNLTFNNNMLFGNAAAKSGTKNQIVSEYCNNITTKDNFINDCTKLNY